MEKGQTVHGHELPRSPAVRPSGRVHEYERGRLSAANGRPVRLFFGDELVAGSAHKGGTDAPRVSANHR